MVEDGAFSHEIDYFTIFKEILNPEVHPNCITGSKVMAILPIGWILPVGGVALGRLCTQPAKQACSNEFKFKILDEKITEINSQTWLRKMHLKLA